MQEGKAKLKRVEFSHPLYKPCDPVDADGVCWFFRDTTKNSKLEMAPFKLPPLEDDEIRINTAFAGICHSDVHEGRGDLAIPHLPVCLGHEIMGYVREIGKKVKDFKVGDRVVYGYQRMNCGQCPGCLLKYENLCSNSMEDYATVCLHWGGYSTVVQQPAKFAFHAPAKIPDEFLPSLMCAGITTYAPIARFCKKSAPVAIVGIGGLGHLAVQFASKWGSQVTAFTSTKDDKTFESLIKNLGAQKVVDSLDEKALIQEMSKYDVVILCVPGADKTHMARYVDLVRPMGTVVMLGLSPSFAIEPIFPLVFKQVYLAGSNIGSISEIKDMLDFAETYDVKPKIELYPFEDVPKAFDNVENGKPIFRCVVNVEAFSKLNGFWKEIS